jgi:hypothetical protein
MGIIELVCVNITKSTKPKAMGLKSNSSPQAQKSAMVAPYRNNLTRSPV